MVNGSGHAGLASGFGRLVPLLGAVLLGYLALPLAALFIVQSPAAVVETLRTPLVIRSALHTFVSATASTILAVFFGVPLALWLARSSTRTSGPVTALVVMPLVLPPVVSGMLLLVVVGPTGLGGLTGLTLSRSLVGVVLAQTFVAAPFVVLPARSAFEGVDRTLVEAAWTHGASEWRAFRRVTLPLATRGILAGITLAFARAAGEFGATLMLAYYPRTLPVQVWVSFQAEGVTAAFPVALLLVVLAVSALAVVRGLGSGLSLRTPGP